MKGLYYYTLLWIYELTKEIGFRVLSLVFYPIAYTFRAQIRASLYKWNESFIKYVTFTDYRPLTPSIQFRIMPILFLWFFLDDSPAKDNINDDGSPSYDSSTSRGYYPSDFVYNNKILRNFWWSCIRNNSVNFISFSITGGWVSPIQYETLWGVYDERIDKSDDNSYYVEGMYLIRVLHKDGTWRTRFTYVGEIFGRKIGIWQGESKGSGRFSFSIRM